MKNTNTLRAAGILLLAALLLSPAGARAFQKASEADKQAQKGAEHLAKKDWGRAADSYQKAVRADARHVEANYGLGLAYMNLRRTNEALAAFANVVAAQPNPRAREALVHTGAIHFALQRFKEAADALEQAAALGDIGPAGHYFLGKAQLQSGRDDRALDSLRRAADDPQHGADANLSIGLLLLKGNKAREAVAPLERAVRAGAQPAAVAQMLLGNAYLAADRPEEALKALGAADPNQFHTQLGLGFAHLSLYRNEEAVAALTAAQRLQPASPEAFVGLGNAYTRLTRYREADDAYARALALKPDGAEALMGRAVLHYYQGQYPLLVETARRAAQAAPQSAGAQTLLGAALATTGDMAGGLRAAREAARLEPENYWPRHVLGFILVREDKPSEALTEARAAARLRPNDPGTQNLLAYVLNQLGQHAEALQAAQGALANKHEPADEGWAHYNIATAQEKLGRAEESRASYGAAIRAYNQPGRTLDPDDLYLMGNAYLRLEQDPAAVKAFQQAIKVRPAFAQARYNLGVAHFASGNRKGAQDEYNALRRLDPARAAKLQAVIGGRPAPTGATDMKQRPAARPLARALLALALLGGAPFVAGTRAPLGGAAGARPQGGGMAVREPLTRDWLLRALRGRPLDEAEVVWRIEAYGSNYLPDAEGERELRAAGATDRILAALRKCHRVVSPGAGGEGLPAAPVDYTRPFEYCQLTTPSVVTHRPYPDLKEDPLKGGKPSGARGVRLSVVLNPDGTVTDIRVITDLPDKLAKKFAAAARRIKFRPAEKDGRRVAERATLEYIFGY